MPKRLYLCGPMSGLPNHNFPAFIEAARWLRGQGYDVVNPAELDGGNTDGEWADFLKRDLVYMLQCDGLAVLPGWQDSAGAKLEITVALSLGLPACDARTMELLDISGAVYLGTSDQFARNREVVTAYDHYIVTGEPDPIGPIDDLDDDDAEPWVTAAESIAEEADRLVNGPRQADYGHPADDFAKTALIWSGILRPKLRADIFAEEVALCMVGVKLSREVNEPKRDNIVDAIGYLLCLDKIHERHREERESA